MVLLSLLQPCGAQALPSYLLLRESTNRTVCPHSFPPSAKTMPSRPKLVDEDEDRDPAPNGTCLGYPVGYFPLVPSAKAYPPAYYDQARKLKVPDRPWGYGDSKPVGRGHVVICVSGHAALVADLNGNDILFPDTDKDPMRFDQSYNCLLYTSPSPRDKRQSRMPSSA